MVSVAVEVAEETVGVKVVVGVEVAAKVVGVKVVGEVVGKFIKEEGLTWSWRGL